MLSQASLPYHFWDRAFHTAVYLINRLPASHTNMISVQVLFKTTPNYAFLKVFGCACFPLLRPYNNHKLHFRSSECTFLGYSRSHKGYKCLDASGRLFISKDVLFNESVFPFNYLKLPSQSNHVPSSIPSPSFHTSNIITCFISPEPYSLH